MFVICDDLAAIGLRSLQLLPLIEWSLYMPMTSTRVNNLFSLRKLTRGQWFSKWRGIACTISRLYVMLKQKQTDKLSCASRTCSLFACCWLKLVDKTTSEILMIYEASLELKLYTIIVVVTCHWPFYIIRYWRGGTFRYYK